MRRAGVLGLMTAVVLLLLLVVIGLRADKAAPSVPKMPEATDGPGYEMMYQRSLALLKDIEVTLADGEGYRVNACMAFDEADRMLGVYSSLGQPLVVAGREDFALDAAAYQMLLLAAQGLPATAHYPALDQSACGLAQPSARLLIRYTDGSEIGLRIGRKTASGFSCYAAMDGDAETYLVPYDFYDVVTRPLNAQHRLPAAAAYTSADAVQLAVDGTSQGRIIVTRQENNGRVLHWQVTSPVLHDASDKAVAQYLEGLCAVHAEAYAGTAYDASDLAGYGLDKPVRYVAAFSDGAIRDLQVGRDAGDGRVYVRMDSTGDVYEISRTQLAFAQDAGLDMIMDRFVDLVPLNTVRAVSVHVGEASWQLAQAWSGEAAAAEAWSINGEMVDQHRFSEVYAALVGLQFDKTADAAVGAAEPIMTITYVLRSGQSRQLVFRRYDMFYDEVTTAGGASLLVRHSKLESILQALEEYAHETK